MLKELCTFLTTSNYCACGLDILFSFVEPLPVLSMHADTDEKNGVVNIVWTPNPDSTQDTYLISYHEVSNLSNFCFIRLSNSIIEFVKG